MNQDNIRMRDDVIERAGQAIGDDSVPAFIYTDPEVYQLEAERIFRRSWNFLAHESEVPNPGDFVVRYILDDSIIVSRGADGVVRAFLNVCRHRGMQVCRAEMGNTKRFTCPYHGWLYDNEGALVSVPMERPYFGVDGIDREANSLSQLPNFDSYEGFLFGSLDPEAEPLRDFLGDFAFYLDIHAKRDPDGLEVVGEPQRWRLRANWKTGAENFMGDSYHAQYTHRSVFMIGLHPNTAGDFQAKGSRNGVHVDAGPGTMSMARQSAEQRGYTPEMVASFRQTLPPEQTRLLFEGETPLWPTRTHLFPNMSMLNAGAYVAKDKLVPFLTCRVWRPLGPEVMEVWSWVLVERNAPAWFKRQTQRAYVLTFGSSGTEEQDDVENFHGIVRAMRGTASQEIDQTLAMGRELGPEHTDVDWPAPGSAVGTTFTDAGNRRFMHLWLEGVSGDPATTTSAGR